MDNNVFLYYGILINIITCLAFAIDKAKAIRGKWRIPEATLIGLAMIGGSVGALLGMHLFHHKTRKVKFAVGIPVILVMQLAAIYLIGRA